MRERRARRAKRVAIVKKLINFSFLYLVFFTIYFSMITLSKYTGTVIGTGTASVAKWEVSTNNNVTSKEISLIAGNTTQEYKIKVIGNSEVSGKYSIVVSSIPNNVKVKLDNKEYVLPINNTITFSDVGKFDATNTSQTNEHTLTFDATIDADTISNEEIELEVIFVQDEL